MDTKALRVEVKDAAKGEVSAVFATFNVKDRDGDVTLQGAFEDGAEALISAYNHASWQGALPVGKGTISSTKTEAIFTGQFFMDTKHGEDTFRTVKNVGRLQEWSYGFDILKYSFGEFEGEQVRFLEKQLPHEVSPVLLGAGIDTRTLSAKGLGVPMKFADEATAVVAAVKALSDRAADVMAKRQEKGKGLGAESGALLEQVAVELKRLDGLLHAPEPHPDDSDVAAEYLRFVANSRGLVV